VIFKTDFTVIEKAKSFSVHGRRSYLEGGQWVWSYGWYVGTYRTRERAEAEAERLNKCHTA